MSHVHRCTWLFLFKRYTIQYPPFCLHFVSLVPSGNVAQSRVLPYEVYPSAAVEVGVKVNSRPWGGATVYFHTRQRISYPQDIS